MKILVVGGGGREHALVWRLAQDGAREIFCAPGNGGTAALARNLPIAADDVEALLAWAERERPALTVVGPEAPLCLGIADRFAAAGLPVFGPCLMAAQLEGSKLFAKEVMAAAGVPTAQAQVFESAPEAIAALDALELPVVVKADGLAAGKGVIIATTRAEAVAAIESILCEGCFGAAGARLLLERFLVGEEVSILALVDGSEALLLPPSQDHKRIFDDDQGPNTGGMGAYTPVPCLPAEHLPEIKERIIMPVVRELKRRGITYQGVLYAGLMLCGDEIYVLEFNARFGDPETQALLPRIGGNLLELLQATVEGRLAGCALQVRPEAAATVILAAGGYPGSYRSGDTIEGLAEAQREGCLVFHGGTALKGEKTVTAGGRVLAVSALGADLSEALALAYRGVARINFEGMHYRRDIGRRATGDTYAG